MFLLFSLCFVMPTVVVVVVVIDGMNEQKGKNRNRRTMHVRRPSMMRDGLTFSSGLL